MSLSRRRAATSLGCALFAGLMAMAPAAGAKGFDYGVTAAEVDTNSAILWARAAKPGTALVQVVRGGGFGGCDLRGAPGRLKVAATMANDLTVQKKVGGLNPGTAYRYRFCMAGGRASDIGRFETAPKPGQNRTITFALAGDQDARPLKGQKKPFWNNFRIWDLIRGERNDFNILMGDTIYSDTEVPGYKLSDVALTVPEKWRAYRLNLGQDRWAKARGAAAYYAHWDDHEFVNDFSPFENRFPLGVGNVNLNGKTLYKRGVRAFRDYNPVTWSKRNGIYRSFRWGKNLELFFLDERSFRSRSADYDGTCDNPQSGEPDFAPTAPQSNRNVFSLIAASLSAPVSQQCLDRINDPKRTMLGTRQLNRFKNAIKNSDARWKAILNEVPIQQYYALPYDRWEGYEAERQKILKFLRSKVKNVVFLTTDVHANLVNDARLKTLEQGGPVDSGILDITTGPVATAGYSLEIDDAIGSEGAGSLVQSLFLKPAPPNGVGMSCASTDFFSYAQVTVSKRRFKVQLKGLDGKDVPDSGDRNAPVNDRCEPVVLTAR